MAKYPFKTESIQVLVSDEHDLIRKSIEKVLSRIGIEQITEAHRGKDLKRLAQSHSYDIYIMDVHYADADGFDILNMIRSKDLKSDIPIIVVTGESNRDDIMKVIDLGASDYILKPFQAEELEKKIVSVLSKYHSPTPTTKLIRKAESLISEKSFDDAKKILGSLANKKKGNAAIDHLLALISYEEGNKEDAISKLIENTKKYPEYLKNFKSLSNIFLSEQRTEEAVEALTKELELNPKQILRQIKLANIHLKSGNNPQAIEHFRQALLENNRNPEALYGMGVAYAKSKNLEKSLYYFKRLRRQYPDNSKPLETVVRFCTAIKKPKIAEMMLRDEKKSFPNRLDTYQILTKLYVDSERPEDAEETLKEAVQKNPSNLEAYKMLARFYESNDNPEEAVEVYVEYVKRTKDPAGHVQIAEVFLKSRNFAKAISSVHAGLANSPEDPRLLKMLCISTLKTQQLAKGYFIQKRLFSLEKPEEGLVKKHKELKKLLISRRDVRKRIKKSAS